MNGEIKSRVRTLNTRRMKYPGIRPLSRELGITFGHLWKVLDGERRGRPGLIEDYWALVCERYGREA